MVASAAAPSRSRRLASTDEAFEAWASPSTVRRQRSEFCPWSRIQLPAGLSKATTGTPHAMSSSGRYDGWADTVRATPTSQLR